MHSQTGVIIVAPKLVPQSVPSSRSIYHKHTCKFTGSRAVKTIVAQLVAYAENEEKTKKTKEKELKISKDPRETMQSVMSYVSDKNEGMKYVTGVNCSLWPYAPQAFFSNTTVLLFSDSDSFKQCILFCMYLNKKRGVFMTRVKRRFAISIALTDRRLFQRLWPPICIFLSIVVAPSIRFIPFRSAFAPYFVRTSSKAAYSCLSLFRAS